MDIFFKKVVAIGKIKEYSFPLVVQYSPHRSIDSRRMIHVGAGVQLFVATVFALYVTFVTQAVYDGVRDRMQFKTVPVMTAEVLAIVVAGAAVMSVGYDAIGAGIMLGGLLGIGAMNLIYMSSARPMPRSARMAARHTH